ncbi:unnamed protein product [Thlaspi arvense]|uniref:Pentatricopeptide repeat-containing protein n=1 Tax=Thlaspi arvense TaxID=13288 RepID=A0AAU9RFZ3_THLAR|nr:unnamed protein product [Thlaspi arvense]
MDNFVVLVFTAGLPEEALDCFRLMVADGCDQNDHTYVGAVSACANLGNARTAKEIHGRVYRIEEALNSFVSNSLINLYGKCGLLKYAQSMFDAITEQTLFLGIRLFMLLSAWRICRGLDCLLQFLRAGMNVDEFCCASVLSVCAEIQNLVFGKQVHSHAVKCGIRMDQFVVTGLINFFMKCGELDMAYQAFWETNEPLPSAWTALMGGCVQQGKGKEAIVLFPKIALFCYCGEAAELANSLLYHKTGFDSHVVVGSALIDMYAKCGREALEIYEMMERDGIKPNDITFVGVLSACGHMGLLEEGLQYFDSMIKDHEITPRTDHLACIVNLFARKGETRSAYDFIKHSPIEPEDTSALVMLSNIYAKAKMWNETAKIRRSMKERALKKDPGYSWIELRSNVYSFSSMHDLNSGCSSMHEILNGLTAQLFDTGYFPCN